MPELMRVFAELAVEAAINLDKKQLSSANLLYLQDALKQTINAMEREGFPIFFDFFMKTPIVFIEVCKKRNIELATTVDQSFIDDLRAIDQKEPTHKRWKIQDLINLWRALLQVLQVTEKSEEDRVRSLVLCLSISRVALAYYSYKPTGTRVNIRPTEKQKHLLGELLDWEEESAKTPRILGQR